MQSGILLSTFIEKAVVPLIRFLKSTEIGEREGAKEREREWARRKDQVGENLLG